MNKLSIFVLLAVAVCSCYGISDRRSIRSASDVSAEEIMIPTADVSESQGSDSLESNENVLVETGNKLFFNFFYYYFNVFLISIMIAFHKTTISYSRFINYFPKF